MLIIIIMVGPVFAVSPRLTDGLLGPSTPAETDRRWMQGQRHGQAGSVVVVTEASVSANTSILLKRPFFPSLILQFSGGQIIHLPRFSLVSCLHLPDSVCVVRWRMCLLQQEVWQHVAGRVLEVTTLAVFQRLHGHQHASPYWKCSPSTITRCVQISQLH